VTLSRLRIGVVTTSYPRVAGEAAGSFVAGHVAALRAAGHEVDVVGAHVLASDLFYGAGAPDELEAGGMQAWTRAAWFTTRLTAAVARRARSWDLIVAHWLVPSVLAALPAGVPVLAIAHGGDIHTLRRLHLLAPLLRLMRARSVQLVFVSEQLRALAVRSAPALTGYLAAALVQPMGIDVERFAAIARARRADRCIAPASAAAEPPRPLVAVVARLVPIKGVDVAITAHALAGTESDLVLAGDGPARPQLEAHAARLRDLAAPRREHGEAAGALGGPRTSAAGRSVSFVGAIDASERDRLLARAAMIVVPSRVLPSGRTEGMPMIALEALAAGVPIVASAVGGLTELTGITRVRPDDPHALAAAIDRVLGDAHGDGAVASTPPSPDIAALAWPEVSRRLLEHARPLRTSSMRNRRHE
jgi:glycosyltransferase involved in cell wall biosynthesis